jgi:multidrug efflux system membrane fusion protein
VKVAPALVDDVPIYLSGIGTVQAFNTVNVQSRIDGEIMQIQFREGQDVKQGDVLAIIDPRPLQAQLEQQIAIRQKNQALLDGAMLDMKRYETLVLKDFATRQQVDQQRALVDQHKAQIKNDDAQIDYVRTQLGYATIRAPINGRVGIRQVD